MATGVRILTPDGAAIDEFEVYAEAYVPPPPPALVITPAGGFFATWDGNDGDHFDPTGADVGGALVPDNLALAANGATAFSSSEPLTTEGISAEIAGTKPLSVTMSERIEAMREWAAGRAVRAN